MATAALLLVGLLLVVVGILAGGSLPFVGLGVAALIVAAILETLARRRA